MTLSYSPQTNRAIRGVRHGAWLLPGVTLPQSILMLLLWRDFAIIRLEAPEESGYWHMYLGLLAGLLLASTLYGAWCWRRGRAVAGRILAPTLLIAYIFYLYWFLTDQQHLYPRSIPAMMVSPDNGLLYGATFLTPALLYALVLAVFELTPEREEPGRVWRNFGALVCVPALLYLVMQLGGNFWTYGWDRALSFAMPVVLISATVVFLFLLVRGVILLGRGRTGELFGQPAVRYPFRALIGVVLPLAGLYLNNHGEAIEMAEFTHVFGDFDHPAFYLLAFLNGMLLVAPDGDDPRYRVGLFLGRLFFLPFSLYFCVVFMPYLPLSLLAIVVFGLGFLMLTPLVLIFVHLRAVIDDYRAIDARSGRLAARRILAAGLVSLLLWPAVITGSYWHERRTLLGALDYVYEADYRSGASDLDLFALRKTLLEIRRYKVSAGTPYLGLYYRWLVLDNLTVSDAKLDRLQTLFFGDVDIPPVPRGIWSGGATFDDRIRSGAPPAAVARLSAVRTRTTYDPEREIYRSTVDLRVVNPERDVAQAEYNTSFALPVGAFVGEYYLDIGERREYGMLAEKKSALWIYNQITARRLDPGILYYEDDTDAAGRRKLRLRVFPVTPDQQRRSGFEILHVEPLHLELDGRRLSLDAPHGSAPAAPAGRGTRVFAHGVYVAGAARSELPAVRRQPYYHFILDCSLHGAALPDGRYVDAMQDLLRRMPLSGTGSRVRLSCVNFERHTIGVSELSRENLVRKVATIRRAVPRRGSLALDRALLGLSLGATPTIADTERFPVFVVLSPALSKAYVGDSALPDLIWLFPEGAYYYSIPLTGDASAFALHRHSLLAPDLEVGRKQVVTAFTFAPTVLLASSPAGAARELGPVVLARGTRPALVPVMERAIAPDELSLSASGAERADQGPKAWQTALSGRDLLELAAVDLNHLLHPAQAAQWQVPMVRVSMAAHVLLRQTSFLVVETEGQKLALRRLQDRVLSGHSALDPGEEPLRMDEPDLLWFAIFGALAALVGLFWRHRRFIAPSTSVERGRSA